MSYKLDRYFKRVAASLGSPAQNYSGGIDWECPSNIALVKYWGKKPVQLPINPSVSFVLHECKTILSMYFSVNNKLRTPALEYFFEGKPDHNFKVRLLKYLDRISYYMPFINHLELTIQTRNTFPYSAGIASSASSFGAFALAVCSAEQQLFGTLGDDYAFRTKASFLARLGSGSASRSIFGGFSAWGKTEFLENSSDEVAVPISKPVHPVFQSFYDTILIIDSGEKAVSSSTGHDLVEDHPFKMARIKQARDNTKKILEILNSGDESEFIGVVEEEALTLHAMMLTSQPGYILFRPNTVEVIGRIRHFREQTGYPVCFTLDAGANVHLLYPEKVKEKTRQFIDSGLKSYCEKGKIIHDMVGNGPVKLI